MEIKKVAILTSGGDAPGMNAAVRAVINTLLDVKIKPYVVYEGYKGLVNGRIKAITRKESDLILNKGGTFIYSARYPEFKEKKIRMQAIKQLELLNIQALVVMGGDGTYKGANALSKEGIKTIALPATIDNDIPLTDITIGYETAIETTSQAVEKIRDTHESHNRIGIIETMGRNCGDLAINVAIASGAEVLSIPERKLTEEQIINEISKEKQKGKRAIIVVVTEGMYDVYKLAIKVEKKLGFGCRAAILGHIQRGGAPTATDKIIATRMGVFAVKKLVQGKTGVAISLRNGKLSSKSITEVVNTRRDISDQLLEQYDATN